MNFRISLTTSLLLVVAPLGVCYGSELEPISGYRLTAGDRVLITVFGHEDLSGEFDVSAENVISMPLIPEISATGLTVNELEYAIVDALQPDYLKNPKVSVEIVNLRPFYIMGEVSNPGRYPFTNDMTVMIAVALAGGFTYRANKKEAIVRRMVDDEIIDMKVDMNSIVQPGDTIEIRERFF
jgi:polysaccharide export outer membrane protein